MSYIPDYFTHNIVRFRTELSRDSIKSYFHILSFPDTDTAGV